ncbi:hypothetical protein BDW02DRAFT_336117 [Decorospora gaudefroyi]|uniref:Uncharacterized protein n=1 Tax=Decorospora gaudefroyi TaxID=184978 RepID=A0A6A5KVT4_9PLEO|nr:hypothetical protein BDW02DRAFT_336117 [Decorospora gaudefroyi]
MTLPPHERRARFEPALRHRTFQETCDDSLPKSSIASRSDRRGTQHLLHISSPALQRYYDYYPPHVTHHHPPPHPPSHFVSHYPTPPVPPLHPTQRASSASPAQHSLTPPVTQAPNPCDDQAPGHVPSRTGYLHAVSPAGARQSHGTSSCFFCSLYAGSCGKAVGGGVCWRAGRVW